MRWMMWLNLKSPWSTWRQCTDAMPSPGPQNPAHLPRPAMYGPHPSTSVSSHHPSQEHESPDVRGGDEEEDDVIDVDADDVSLAQRPAQGENVQFFSFSIFVILTDVPMMKMEWLQSDDEWAGEFRSKMDIAKSIFREGILCQFSLHALLIYSLHRGLRSTSCSRGHQVPHAGFERLH